MSPRITDKESGPGYYGELTALAASGITRRGPSALCRPPFWIRAMELISAARKIAVISGFFVSSAEAPETDGPPGALVLARALRETGRDAEIWTDSFCVECMRKTADVLSFPSDLVKDVSDANYGASTPDLLIYLERLGRAGDGAYYNMRGEDISRNTPPLDSFALSGQARVIGIGDGGNEVGMGCFKEELSGMMPGYSHCLCVVPADVCIPVDVSNWGGYALAAAMSRAERRWLGQTDDEERAMLESLSQCGAVDGVSRLPGLTVDGLGMDEQLRVLGALRKLSMSGT